MKQDVSLARMTAKTKVRADDALNIAKSVAIPAVILARWCVVISVGALVVASLALFAALR